MKKHLLLLTGMLILPTTCLAATPEPGTITITSQIGGYIFEGNQDLDDGLMLGVAPGYFFTRELAAEMAIQYVDSEFDNSTNSEDIDGWLYHVDLLYHFFPDNKIVPFIAAGIGGISLDDLPGEKDSSAQVNYGAGLKYELTDNLDLRGDLRHMISFDDNYNNLAALVGLTYNFGSSPQKKAPAQSTKAREPAPSPAPVPTPVVPPILKDTDQDGVTDNLDQCPDTPANLAVDEQGCPIPEEINVNLNIEFDTDKADIKSTYHSHCQEVSDFLNTYPEATAIFEGHTDNVGDSAYNQQLSQQRAEVVRQYFIDNFNIAPNRLTAKGFGEAKPTAANDNPAGRQDNRRVVATIKTMQHKAK